ncbi:hypothetical protein JM16_006420 [Phytophthora kernoviae]|uniref:START domain-containing protein n=1 Tax=Phytophthora kernoviae TaxID=325452 RepID=A0A8T0LTG8_9STRA|nr:hypothetical protein JM16_006420 [Phytophthora kernoviae]
MAFLLEGETDETLAAALAFVEQPEPLPPFQHENWAPNDENDVVLPSLDDPEAAEVLDALSAELPALSDKTPSSVNAVTALKQTVQRLFNHQVAPCPPPQPKNAATGKKKAYTRKKPLGYNPNKARNERKLELLYLRKTVVDMELELQRLQEIKGSTDHDDGVPRVWKEMCGRQLQKRVKSERENARLKMVLEGQIKIAKSMEQILKKRTVLRAMESCGSNKRSKHTHVRPLSEPAVDAKIFEALLAGVEASYREIDAVFEANSLGRTEAPKSNAQMRDGVDGMHLEIFVNKMLPFGMHATGQAVWQHFKGTDVPYRWHHSKTAGTIESTEDTMVECFGMEMYDAKTKTTAGFNVKQILRRYIEEERVVVVWRSHIEPLEFSNKRFAGIHFEEKGYVVVKPPAHASSGSDDEDYTLLQTCYIISPDLSDQTLNDDVKAGALTEFVLNATAANISASHDMIENVLLDQSVQHKSNL